MSSHRRILALAWALTASLALAGEPPSTEPTPVASGLQPEATAPATEEGLLRVLSSKVTLLGYAKVGYFWVTPGGDDALIGARSGFRVLNLRAGVRIAPTDTLEVVASVDGAMPQRRDNDPLEGQRIVELRDAYVRWYALKFLEVRAGQFKAPYNAETLLGDGDLPFIRRSIISDGILPPEGYTRDGLSLDRQIGVEVGSDRLGSGSVGLRYAVALVNGNGPNTLNNDNNSVTPVGRVVVELFDKVSVGLNGYLDLHTGGERPNRITEQRLGLGADVGVSLAGFNCLATLLTRSTRTVNGPAELPPESALGAMASVRYLYKPLGLEGGVRVAYFEPSNVQADDRLTELTAMVGWRPSSVPARLLLQYTARLEEPAASVANDSVDVMVQVTF